MSSLQIPEGESYSLLSLIRAFQLHDIIQNFKKFGYKSNYKGNTMNTIIPMEEEFLLPQDELDCKFCKGTGRVQEDQILIKCEECCGLGTSTIAHKIGNSEIRISSSYFINNPLNDFEVDSIIFHIPSGREFRVFVNVDGKINPFFTLNDYCMQNFKKVQN